MYLSFVSSNLLNDSDIYRKYATIICWSMTTKSKSYTQLYQRWITRNPTCNLTLCVVVVVKWINTRRAHFFFSIITVKLESLQNKIQHDSKIIHSIYIRFLFYLHYLAFNRISTQTRYGADWMFANASHGVIIIIYTNRLCGR